MESLENLQHALSARSVMKGWAEGAELLELVRTAHRAGWLERLREGTTVAELAATGVPAGQAGDVLTVLASAGVVDADGDAYRLSPGFAALVVGVAGVDVPTTLDATDLVRRRVGQAVQPPEVRGGLDGGQALALARDWGVRPTPAAQQLFGLVYQAIPGYRSRLERGGPLLDVGSGVGGALLTTLTLFSDLRAVGVEVVPEVAAETRRRAQDAGVADRVEIRGIDARDLDDDAAFTACFWAQAFFAADARAATLAAILRALRPDGLLLVQEVLPPQATSVRAQLDQLFFRQQEAAVGVSAEDLATEVEAAGFQNAQIIDSPLGRLVLARTPAGRSGR